MAKKVSSASDTSSSTDSTRVAGNGNTGPGQYTVVARRYRPRSFDELVGQQTVAAALKSAIESDRVGHAYLFTGARGVGKTSTARIFAKALNLSKLSQDDVTEDLETAIDSGEDMDVIEIDGASNRGIEEIRQLRANATVRPSRAAYKIYIIDEVHMLTLPAFNALLKTLEEPPEHVKFIFCTTDPEKIPITVLSRCQRFDFAPIKTDQIKNRLAEICAAENVAVRDEAIALIARRANGSMRDSQSLLEQLLSFSGDTITIESVHAMLGTADDTRLTELVMCLIERQAGRALQLVEDATQAGVDAGQMAEQLLGYLRDVMAIGIGANGEVLKTANPADVDQLKEMAGRWGTMTLLATIQMLDETLVRMRHSVQSRILLEVCLVQICHLQDLQGIANLAQAIRENAPLPPVIPARSESSAAASTGSTPVRAKTTPAAEKKNVEVARISNDLDLTLPSVAESTLHETTAELRATSKDSAPTTQVDTKPVASQQHEFDSDTSEDKNPLEIWRQSTVGCEGLLSECAQMAIAIETTSDPSIWEVVLPAGGQFAIQILLEPNNLEVIRRNLGDRFGIRKGLKFKVDPNEIKRVDAGSQSPQPPRSINQGQLIRSVSNHSLIAQMIESLGAEVTKVDVPPNYRLSDSK